MRNQIICYTAQTEVSSIMFQRLTSSGIYTYHRYLHNWQKLGLWKFSSDFRRSCSSNLSSQLTTIHFIWVTTKYFFLTTNESSCRLNNHKLTKKIIKNQSLIHKAHNFLMYITKNSRKLSNTNTIERRRYHQLLLKSLFNT